MCTGRAASWAVDPELGVRQADPPQLPPPGQLHPQPHFKGGAQGRSCRETAQGHGAAGQWGRGSDVLGGTQSLRLSPLQGTDPATCQGPFRPPSRLRGERPGSYTSCQ